MAIDNTLLTYLCDSVNDNIAKHSPVSEKIITDLSLFVDRLIHNDYSAEFPPSYVKMVEMLDCFWYYWLSSYQEYDLETILSYTRVYQIICMYRVYLGSKNYKKSVRSDAIRYKKQKKLLQLVHDKPGVSFEILCKMLETTRSSLAKLINDLIEQGYVYTSTPGNYVAYSLSNKGLDLYKFISKLN